MNRQQTPDSSNNALYLCILEDLFTSARDELIDRVFEFAPEAIMVLDHANNIVLANDAVSRLYSDAKTCGKKCWEVFQSGMSSCDKHPELCWLKKTFATGKTIRSIVPQTLKTGQTKYVAVSASPILDHQKNVQNVVVILRDVTSEYECHELQGDLLQQRQLYEQAPEGLFAVNAEGTITKVNDTWLKLFGYTREEAVNKLNMCDLTARDQQHLCNQALSSLISGIKINGAELEWVRNDGSTFWSRTKALPIMLPSNNGSIGLISIRDIDDDPTEEEMLGQSSRFVKALMDSMGEGILVLDTDFRIVETNKKFLEISQLRSENVIGEHCYRISHGSEVPCWEIKQGGSHECPTRTALQNGRVTAAIHVHSDAKKRKHYVEVKAFPLKDETGKVFQVIETHTDITERKNLEDRLQQSEKMEAIGTMAGGIAHDFNNLLTPIIGNAEIALASMSPDDPWFEEFKEIKYSGERAAELINHILAFSRRQVLEKKEVNLNTVVQNLVKMLKRVIPENVSLETDLMEGLWEISADPTQLEQIIVNLSVNARDAMPNGGKLLIETRNIPRLDSICHTCGEQLSGSYVVLMVSDNGTGIDDEIIAHIFDPFFTTKKLGEGTGMGLSTVLGIMHQHDGHINLYSETGLGTTFKVYFPKSETRDAKADESGTQSGTENKLTCRETILLVDDDASVLRMLARMLSRFGYTILSASNGEEALGVFQKNREAIDLVLTDVVMPGMGGRVLMEEIHAIRPEVPSLFMSGYSLNAVHHKYILEKGIDYIQKPPTMDELLQKVRTILDRAKGH
jgi:PAS domain S-box-containing protein